jgi:predicted nucleic acid-binding Zn ribbon protein
MPTYVYETIPAKKGAKARQYEIRQSIKDSALTEHPETGEPIRRIIAGSVGLVTGASPTATRSSGHTHSSSCGCHAGGCGR